MAKSLGREKTPVAPRRRVWAWVLPLLALAAALVLLWLGVDYLSVRALRNEVPMPPELARQPVAVAKQIREADAAARQDPESGDAAGRLGMVYHANALTEYARSAYQLAIRVAPKEFRWPYYLGALEMGAGENERALAFLTRAVELNPRYVHAWARLGENYFRRNLWDDAAQAFKKALELEPDHPHATFGLARLAAQRDDWNEVVRLMEAALKVHPNFGPAQGMLAIAYNQLGQPELARLHEGRGLDAGFQMDDPLLNAVYDLSATASILVTQAQIAKNLGEGARTLSLLRRAVEVEPGNKDVRLAIGRFLIMPGLVTPATREEARRQLEEGLKIDPKYVNLRDEYASVLYDMGDVTGAQAQWQRVLADEPGHAMALMSLGQIYFGQRDFTHAFEYYQRGMQVPPDTPYSLGDRAMGYHRLGLAAWAVGRSDEAIAAFRQAIDENPHMCDAYLDQVRLLKELNREEEALPVCRTAIEQLRAALALRPNDARALAGLGYVELCLSDVSAAIGHLQAALAIDPQSAMNHFYLGNALMQAGQRDEAISHYETSLRLQPNYRPARDALAKARGA